MKSTILSVLVALVLCLAPSTTFGFVARPSVSVASQTAVGGAGVVSTLKTSSSTTTSLNVFGNRKSKAQKASPEDDKFWQGDWVCKDCGYIYNKVSPALCWDCGSAKARRVCSYVKWVRRDPKWARLNQERRRLFLSLSFSARP